MNWLADKLVGLVGYDWVIRILSVGFVLVGAFIGWSFNDFWMKPKLAAVEADLSEKESAWARERLEAEQARLASLARAREQETAWRDAAHKTEKENAALRKKNDLAAAAARDAALRLRDEGNRITGELNRMPVAAADSGVRAAGAASAALGECGLRYSEVASEHDRCEIERRTLIGAWPR